MSINEQGYTVSRAGSLYNVEISDIWQTMKIKFTVLHTRIHGGQSIRVTGNLPELGNWNKVDPIRLQQDTNILGGGDELASYSAVVNVKVPDGVK